MWKREVTGRRSKVPQPTPRPHRCERGFPGLPRPALHQLAAAGQAFPGKTAWSPANPQNHGISFHFKPEFSRGLFYSNSEVNSGQALSQFHVFQSALPSAFRPFSHCNTPACSSRSSSPCLCHGREDTEQTHSLPEGIIISRTRFSCL